MPCRLLRLLLLPLLSLLVIFPRGFRNPLLLAHAKKHKLPKVCDVAKVKPGDLCALDVYELRPTQFALGMSEIRCKKSRFESMKSSDLRKYLIENPIPVVMGPDPYADVGGGDDDDDDDDDSRPISFYLYDHHHLARALMDADLPSKDKFVVANVTTDFYTTSKNESDFWRTMTNANLLWLFDEKGLQPLNPFFLPMSLLRLQNDPYRSLAYMVRHAGGYEKEDKPFQEFIWGHYFARNHALPFNNVASSPSSLRTDVDHGVWDWCSAAPNDEGTCLVDEDAVLKAHLPGAMLLAGAEGAQDLPGYGMGTPSPPNCGDSEWGPRGDGGGRGRRLGGE